MGQRSAGDSMLMQRIQQLEKERDELQLDVEQLCMQQSGVSSKADAVSQVQARRITSLKQELEVCKKNFDECVKKAYKLEDELMETYNIKTQFADLLKTETEKNVELEKSLKFFQSSVANAILERDRALTQAEKSQEKEEELQEKIYQLEDRLEEITSELLSQKKIYEDLQRNTEAQEELLKSYESVVNFFWQIRSKACNHKNIEDIRDRAMRLLGDPENRWVYGGITKDMDNLHKKLTETEAAMASLQEKYNDSNELAERLMHQLDEVMVLKKNEEEQYLVLKEKMLGLAVMVNDKVKTISSDMVGFKEGITATLEEEKRFFRSLIETSQTSISSIMDGVGDGLTSKKDLTDTRETIQKDVYGKRDDTGSKDLSKNYDSDTREALAIALQEKVATLLLLSQQQERYILEENTFAAQQYRIAELQKQLFEMTADKAKAFMELASLCEELQRIQEKQQQESAISMQKQLPRRTAASNQMLPANWNKDSVQESSVHPRSMTMENNNWSNGSHHWHVKYWLRGFDYVGSKMSLKTILKGRDLNTARLQAQNAALWDILASLQQICTSANHLQQTIVKVASTPLNDRDHATRTIDAVIGEAQHLRMSVSSCLPVCFSGRSLPESPRNQSVPASPRNKTDELKTQLFDAETSAIEADLLPTFGTTCLDSVLLAAEICKAYLDSGKAFTSNLSLIKSL